MARYSKIFFVFIILVLSLWLIPWFYHFMTAQPIRNPFTLYSCIIDDFAVSYTHLTLPTTPYV